MADFVYRLPPWLKYEEVPDKDNKWKSGKWKAYTDWFDTYYTSLSYDEQQYLKRQHGCDEKGSWKGTYAKGDKNM